MTCLRLSQPELLERNLTFSHPLILLHSTMLISLSSSLQRTVSIVGGDSEHGSRKRKSFLREGSGHKMENFTSLSGSRLEESGHGRSNLTSPKGAKIEGSGHGLSNLISPKGARLEGSGHGLSNLASLSGTNSPSRLEGSVHGRNNLTSMAGLSSSGSGRSWNNLTSLVGSGNERMNMSNLDENL